MISYEIIISGKKVFLFCFKCNLLNENLCHKSLDNKCLQVIIRAQKPTTYPYKYLIKLLPQFISFAKVY